MSKNNQGVMSNQEYHIADDFKKSMRRLAGGVSIIAVQDETEKTGITVTSVVSVSVEPPIFMVSVNPQSSAYPILAATKQFSINFLGTQHLDVAKAFSGITGLKGTDRFQIGAWEKKGSSLVLTDSPASFVCVVDEMIPKYGHCIVFGKVISIHLADPYQGSLVYYDRNYYTQLLP